MLCLRVRHCLSVYLCVQVYLCLLYTGLICMWLYAYSTRITLQLTIGWGIVPAKGWCTCPEGCTCLGVGVPARGVYLPRYSPLEDRQTGAKILPCPKLRLRAVSNTMSIFELSFCISPFSFCTSPFSCSTYFLFPFLLPCSWGR